MKKYIFIFIGCLVLQSQAIQAQVSLNLALNSRPMPYLADWYKPVNGQMIIINNGGSGSDQLSIRLQTTLLDANGGVIGSSNLATATIYQLTLGANVFSVADALQLQNLTLSGGPQDLLRRSGRLESGQYQLTVQVVGADSNSNRIYAEQTRLFFVTAFQLPVLMQPVNGAELDARTAQSIIVFRWTNVAAALQQGIHYRVQVFEVLPDQTDMQAFRSNRPLLDEEATKGSNQYLWRSNLPMLDSTANQRFIWTVQTLDERNEPVPTNDQSIQARSEPAVFTVSRKLRQ